MRDLTVLVVTEGEPFAWPFVSELWQLALDIEAHFVLALDRRDGTIFGKPLDSFGLTPGRLVLVDSHGAGYWAACANQAFDACRTSYVFRLDDDERASPNLAVWLQRWTVEGAADQYAFPRACMWPDSAHRIDEQPWWPDPQMRLARRELCYRSQLHEPWRGEAAMIPHAIEHHTYLIHDDAWHARRREAYQRARPGVGYPMPDDQTRTVAV